MSIGRTEDFNKLFDQATSILAKDSVKETNKGKSFLGKIKGGGPGVAEAKAKYMDCGTVESKSHMIWLAHKILQDRKSLSSSEKEFEASYKKWESEQTRQTIEKRGKQFEQAGNKVDRIKSELDNIKAQMLQNIANAANREERLGDMQDKSNSIKESALVFQVEKNVKKLISGMIHADAQADLLSAQKKAKKAEEDLKNPNISHETRAQANRDLKEANKEIKTAQQQISTHEGISDKDFFKILTHGDIEKIIYALDFDKMQSLVGLLLERIPNANLDDGIDVQKVADLLSSDVFWANLKSSMLVASGDEKGIIPKGREKEIEATIKIHRETCRSYFSTA
ncbi:MAG: hypothetical protein LBR92_00965 [Puniceicoccales bacterium]|jgi:hypothetical protein|nr:hypothetical protein [Puniceicoccales bacterium]